MLPVNISRKLIDKNSTADQVVPKIHAADKIALTIMAKKDIRIEKDVYKMMIARFMINLQTIVLQTSIETLLVKIEVIDLEVNTKVTKP